MNKNSNSKRVGGNSEEKIFISLGTNLGDRLKNLDNACGLLNKKLGNIDYKSPIYETEPWGFESSDKFLNQVICMHSAHAVAQVMDIVLSIENELGRTRNKEKYSSRIIDIDILFYGNHIIHEKNIEIPHPRLHERKFVLVPLMDIDPDFMHPGYEETVAKLFEKCEDKLHVKEFLANNESF